MFRLEVSHLQALKQFCYQMLCPLWDPIVFTAVEYTLANVYDYKEFSQCIFHNCKHYGIPKWAKHLVAKLFKGLKMTNL